MKTKKLSLRVLALLFAVVLLCGTMAACTPSATEPTATAGTSDPTDPTATVDPGASTSDEHWVLTASIHDPVQSVKTIFLEEYVDRVLEATNGQVEIQVFPGGVLAGAGAALEAVVNNTVDVAWCFSSYFPGQFPLSDVVAQPLLGATSCQQVTNVLWDLWEKYDEMKTELDDPYKILHLYVNPPNTLFFGKEKVDSIDKIQGLTLRAPSGPITDILARWGATPIFMGPPDVYEALEKGIVDGFSFEYSGMYDFKLFEHVKYYMEMPIYCGPFLLIMNKDVWDAFPADIQEQIDSVSGRDCSLEMATIFQNDQDTKKEMVLSRDDAEAYELTEEEFAKFKAVADEYNSEWVATHSTDTFDAQVFLDDAIALLEQYA